MQILQDNVLSSFPTTDEVTSSPPRKKRKKFLSQQSPHQPVNHGQLHSDPERFTNHEQPKNQPRQEQEQNHTKQSPRPLKAESMPRSRPRFAINNRKEKSPGELAEAKIAPWGRGREGTGAKPLGSRQRR